MCYYCKPDGSCPKEYLHAKSAPKRGDVGASRSEEVQQVQPIEAGGVQLPGGLGREQVTGDARQLEEFVSRCESLLATLLSEVRSIRSRWERRSQAESGSWWNEPPE